jgi:hypothetical protein
MKGKPVMQERSLHRDNPSLQRGIADLHRGVAGQQCDIESLR